MISLLCPSGARCQEVTALLVGPTEAVATNSRVSVWLHYLNPSTREVSRDFPARFEGRLRWGEKRVNVTLELANPDEAVAVSVAGGGFARREYRFALPRLGEGEGVLEAYPIAVNRLIVEIRKSGAPLPEEERQPGRSEFSKQLQTGEQPRSRYNPVDFFKEHFFGYEPFYFIAGTESPNAKFQVSLRYQIVNSEGPLGARVPPLKGINVAYTQTSLWDWDSPSSPFYDSSYKPEVLYLWERVDGGHWADWFRLDLQGGLQHESNGKAEADSRSLNIVYLRPMIRFGTDDSLQFTLQPRVWAYVGDLSDNPDIKDYRGYVDLRATVGWARGLQLAAVGRMGDDWDHQSLQLDLTYPMMRLLSSSFSVYLHAQYFTGYGESFLGYQERNDAFRVGFSIYR